jgi:tetratricopeptide (TPR) repeat protein
MEKSGIAAVLVKRKYESAVDAFEAFNDNHPDHRLQFDLPVPFAEALLKAGELDRALDIVRDVRSDSRNQFARLRVYRAMKLQGDILKEQGNLEDALAVYKELIRVMPNENVINDIIRIRQDVSIFIGMVLIEQEKYRDAEEYFRTILSDVTKSGVTVGNLGKVYLNIGQCRAHFEDWERAQWYFLHGVIAYFDDQEVHKQCLLNVIIALDHLIESTDEEKLRVLRVNSLKEYYRQMTVNYGSSSERSKARDIYQKYK